VADGSWLSRFRRVTAGGVFLPELDGLRIFAIGLVFLWHLRIAILETAQEPLRGTAGPLSYVVDKGWFGVQLFFAISGFVLGLPFARSHLLGAPRPRLADYYVRRLTRLEPPYVLSLVLLLVLRTWALDESFEALLPHFVASLFYVHNVVYDQVSAVSGVAWSLEVEVQFYVLAPLLALLFRVRPPLLRRLLFACLALSAVAVQMAVESRWGFHFRWAGTLPGQLQYFLVGMLLADVHVTRWQSKDESSRWWDAAAIAGWCLLGVALHGSPIVFRLGVLPAIFLVHAGALRGGLFRRFLRAPLVSTIGGMCYSTYLLHTSVIFFFHPLMRRSALPPSYPARFAILVLPAALAVVVVSGLYFVLVERPCMDRTWPARLAAAIRRRLRGRAAGDPRERPRTT
jgi:peptidoglycan/LPS O-acetylase OafA/YrhL